MTYANIPIPVPYFLARSARRANGPELAAGAWEAFEAEAAREPEQIAVSIVESWSGPRVAGTVADVLPLAMQGRVMELFIAVDAEQWGRAEDDGEVAEDKGHVGLGSDDLLDLFAHQTLKNGGRVHAVDLAEMPGGPEALAAAALLRT
jgi:hypothetical protein